MTEFGFFAKNNKPINTIGVGIARFALRKNKTRKTEIMNDEFRKRLIDAGVTDDDIAILVKQELVDELRLQGMSYDQLVALGIRAGSALTIVSIFLTIVQPSAPLAQPTEDLIVAAVKYLESQWELWGLRSIMMDEFPSDTHLADLCHQVHGFNGRASWIYSTVIGKGGLSLGALTIAYDARQEGYTLQLVRTMIKLSPNVLSKILKMAAKNERKVWFEE